VKKAKDCFTKDFLIFLKEVASFLRIIEVQTMNAPRIMKEGCDLIPTRRSLLSRLKNRDDQQSWKLFFDTYWKLIFHAAIKAGLTKEEAEDVVQETVIQVMEKMPGFRYDAGIGSFKGWLLRTAGWRIIDHIRSRQRGVCDISGNSDTSIGMAPIEQMADPWPALERIWDQEWETNLTEVALSRLKNKVDPKHYRVFDLYVLQEWPISRVSQALRVNVAQIYLIKHRLSALLKKELISLRSKPISPTAKPASFESPLMNRNIQNQHRIKPELCRACEPPVRSTNTDQRILCETRRSILRKLIRRIARENWVDA